MENLEKPADVTDEEKLVLQHDFETDEKQHTKKNEIIKKILQSRKEKEKLENENVLLQQKLSALSKESPGRDYVQTVELPQNADKAMFLKILRNIDEKSNNLENFRSKSFEEKEFLKAEISKKEEEYRELNNTFKSLKEKTTLQSINTNTGGKFTKEEVKELLRKEKEAEEVLQFYQLEYIEKEHSLHEAVQKKQSLVEGPVDYGEYEIMCTEIENIIEVSKQVQEETQELATKTSNRVNIFSHLMQKLHSFQKEKEEAASKEKFLEEELSKMRDHLFEEKTKCNKLREKNKELQHKFILLQHPRFIEDYKNLIAENKEAQAELEKLKDTYASCMKIVSE